MTSGGTIPDRGLYGVFLASGDGPGRRVGELDEEMVYESRVGDVFTLGTSSWRIEDITHDQVLVTPAPGQPGRLPFWHGDQLGRPAELGSAVGAFVREVGGLDAQGARARLAEAGLDEWARDNLLAYLEEQRAATGHLPDDRTIVVERFRDEIGDWRLALHSPFGAQVHAPWALAIAGRMRERFGVDVQAMHGDDGIVLRLPDLELDTQGFAEVLDLVTLDPSDVERAVTDEIGGSALFAARFRECAARALLLPRRRPDRRQPLWQQRQRAAALLEVASGHADFPIVLEAVRECLQDVFDVPALTELMTHIAGRRITLVDVESPRPSPFAASLMFGYVAQFLYEGDSPLAERRAAALTLDPTLLADLLGRGEQLSLADLLDPAAVERTAAELQCLTPERAARDGEDLLDLLRVLGPLSLHALGARSRLGTEAVRAALAELEDSRQVIAVRVAGEDRWASTEDAARLRDALGVSLPPASPSRCCSRPQTRSETSSPATPARTSPSPRPTSPPTTALAEPWRPTPCGASCRPAGSSRATSCRSSAAAAVVSSATPRSCGCCAGAPSRRCVTRSSRSSRGSTPASCPGGRAWGAACADATACCGPSSS